MVSCARDEGVRKSSVMISKPEGSIGHAAASRTLSSLWSATGGAEISIHGLL